LVSAVSPQLHAILASSPRDVLLCFFFFQAEDGIRDATVTGVQTCALPISSPARTPTATSRLRPASTAWCASPRSTPTSGGTPPRSEERRVGKECRSGWTS